MTNLHKTGTAALATAAVLALIALFGMTACPNNAGGGTEIKFCLKGVTTHEDS